MREVLKNWAENDYKRDQELDLIRALYLKLRGEGYDFKDLGEKTGKSVAGEGSCPAQGSECGEQPAGRG